MAKTSKQTDKKAEIQLIKILTELCEQFKFDIEGFSWLTHIGKFTASGLPIKVICIFDFQHELDQARAKQKTNEISEKITDSVNNLCLALQIVGKSKHNVIVSFDSQEACDASHHGDWALRLATKLH